MRAVKMMMGAVMVAWACTAGVSAAAKPKPPVDREVAAAKPVALTPYKIVTGSERGTYIQIGRDLAKLVAPGAGIDLEVLPSAGSAENVQRLRHEPGVKLAMVQSDVYQALLDLDASGKTEAGELIRPLRVVMPLYFEEIYFMVRADSKLEFVHDIKDQKINVGPLLSGTAMSATTVYKQMFDTPLASASASYFTHEEALVKLTTDRSVDVVVVVAGQPAKLLADMTPQARSLVKLLKFDATKPASQAALKTYFESVVRASNYPNLLAEDLPSLAVKAYLVTYDYSSASTVQLLRKFARGLCQNITQLQASGHPKWREVSLGLPPLGRGWMYYGPTERELKECSRVFAPYALSEEAASQPAKMCRMEERVLGLCK